MSAQTRQVEAQRNKVNMTKDLAELAKQHGVELSPSLEDIVDKLKSEEASSINNSGELRQLEYILDAFGPAMSQEARERVENAIKDDPCVKDMIECCNCREMEFAERSKQEGQGFICEKCANR